jgi:hypothetical protein
VQEALAQITWYRAISLVEVRQGTQLYRAGCVPVSFHSLWPHDRPSRFSRLTSVFRAIPSTGAIRKWVAAAS